MSKEKYDENLSAIKQCFEKGLQVAEEEEKTVKLVEKQFSIKIKKNITIRFKEQEFLLAEDIWSNSPKAVEAVNKFLDPKTPTDKKDAAAVILAMAVGDAIDTDGNNLTIKTVSNYVNNQETKITVDSDRVTQLVQEMQPEFFMSRFNQKSVDIKKHNSLKGIPKAPTKEKLEEMSSAQKQRLFDSESKPFELHSQAQRWTEMSAFIKSCTDQYFDNSKENCNNNCKMLDQLIREDDSKKFEESAKNLKQAIEDQEKRLFDKETINAICKNIGAANYLKERKEEFDNSKDVDSKIRLLANDPKYTDVKQIFQNILAIQEHLTSVKNTVEFIERSLPSQRVALAADLDVQAAEAKKVAALKNQENPKGAIKVGKLGAGVGGGLGALFGGPRVAPSATTTDETQGTKKANLADLLAKRGANSPPAAPSAKTTDETQGTKKANLADLLAKRGENPPPAVPSATTDETQGTKKANLADLLAKRGENPPPAVPSTTMEGTQGTKKASLADLMARGKVNLQEGKSVTAPEALVGVNQRTGVNRHVK
jgi:hypothetical protein